MRKCQKIKILSILRFVEFIREIVRCQWQQQSKISEICFSDGKSGNHTILEIERLNVEI